MQSLSIIYSAVFLFIHYFNGKELFLDLEFLGNEPSHDIIELGLGLGVRAPSVCIENTMDSELNDEIKSIENFNN